MKKTNKTINKYLIVPIVSLFTLVAIGASLGLSPNGSLGSLGNTVAKAKVETAEAFSVFKEGNVTSLAGGPFTSAAIIDKKLFMWGDNKKGQLGIGDDLTRKTTPVYVDVDGDNNPRNDNILEICVGAEFALARTSSDLYAWGGNAYGQLGLGKDYPEAQYNSPQKIKNIGKVTAISAMNSSSIATIDSNLYVWGYNGNGQLGLGDKNNRNTPTKLSSVGTPKIISAGGGSIRVLNTSNELYTCGANNNGQLGLGDDYLEKEYTTPLKMNTSNLGVISKIYSSTNSSYLINSYGEAFSWGFNFSGILGLGDEVNRNTPTKITIDGKVKQLSGRNVAVGLITDNGNIYTFGSNGFTQLGQGKGGNYFIPTKMPVINESIALIAQLDYHGLAISTSGNVYGWGDNREGNIGVGDLTLREFAIIVDNSSNEHKNLNILDLSTIAGADILREKKVADVTNDELISLIKVNGEDLFTNYKEDNVITIKSIEKKEASYLDSESNEFFGKIEIIFNNDKQCDWTGAPESNTDKNLTITKFKKSETKNISKLSPQNLDKTFLVDDLADELEKNGGLNPDRTILDKFVKFENYPDTMKVLKVGNITRFNSLGELTMDITVDSFKEEGSLKEIIDTMEDVFYKDVRITNLAIPKESKITAKSISSDKTLKGLQWDNFETYFGAPITDEAKLEKLVNLNSFPKGTTYTAQISTKPTVDSNKVGITIQASSYYNDKNEKVASSKTFDEIIFTIPRVSSITSSVIERGKFPKDLKPENFINFVLETQPSDIKEEGTQIVNFTNLDKILKLSELFPMQSEIGLLKIEEDTEFRIANNKISVDGSKVTFFLEVNQIWNKLGFFEKFDGTEENPFVSFEVQLEFPGAFSKWIIIGSSIGAAVLLLVIVLTLYNKTKLKSIFN
ncbi:MAG: RCC1 domain-containing protein [Mycoplasma sp.]